MFVPIVNSTKMSQGKISCVNNKLLYDFKKKKKKNKYDLEEKVLESRLSFKASAV